jgi:hypothetical protein
MNDIYENASNLIEKYNLPNRHTFYQLKHFVIGKEITIQSKLQKCLKEIDARKESLRDMILGIEEANDDIKLIDLKIKSIEKKKIKSNLNKEFKKINLNKLNRKKENLINNISSIEKKKKDCEEEIKFLMAMFYEIEKLEQVKPYDDLQSNMEFWNENFAQELKLRILLQRPLDIELVKCILSLNNNAPIKQELIQMIESSKSNNLSKDENLKIEEKND